MKLNRYLYFKINDAFTGDIEALLNPHDAFY